MRQFMPFTALAVLLAVVGLLWLVHGLGAIFTRFVLGKAFGKKWDAEIEGFAGWLPRWWPVTMPLFVMVGLIMFVAFLASDEGEKERHPCIR